MGAGSECSRTGQTPNADRVYVAFSHGILARSIQLFSRPVRAQRHAFTEWESGRDPVFNGLDSFHQLTADDMLYVGFGNMLILLFAALIKATIVPFSANRVDSVFGWRPHPLRISNGFSTPHGGAGAGRRSHLAADLQSGYGVAESSAGHAEFVCVCRQLVRTIQNWL